MAKCSGCSPFDDIARESPEVLIILFCTSRRHQASKDGETKATESLLLDGGALPPALAKDKVVADER
jgi:hypothetical protein